MWHVGSLIFIDCAASFSCGMWALGMDRGSNPGPLPWECGIITTGPPGKIPIVTIFKEVETSLVVQWPGLFASHAWGAGSISV